ncbi:hypothetical protein F5Y09DRAFT_318433 [Xylaria sp. FL1042]|nr:hypothetical protein F5Y09DRAFT_318433 [Xylaria sp. FL1042]
MDGVQSSRPGAIEGLPPELVCMALSALPDVESLKVAVLSCPLFYDAFRNAETSITTHVLFNQIDASVLPEAMAAFESSCLRPLDKKRPNPNRDATMNFVTQNLRQRSTPPRNWLLKRALPLGRLHSCVEELAKQFAEAALPESSTTHQERCRIQRALYRFEIYCNLFRELNLEESIIYADQSNLFFAKFAPWENEQLGCIHDFLVRAVSPAFNEVVEHNIAWGHARVAYGYSMDAPYIQHILSLGLKKLYEITRTEPYEDRERVLCSGPAPPPSHFFLYEGFWYANERSDDFWLESPDPAKDLPYIKQPFYVDQDSGPADAWRWAHYEESWRNWVYQKNRHSLRKWGYVMWDRCRLEAIGIFHDPWEETDSDNSEWLLDEEEARRRQAELYAWWVCLDDSRLRWHKEAGASERVVNIRRYIGPCIPKRKEPQSLQEAREMLSMLKIPSRSRI